jgi:peptide/nickel transport system substrate-binding protein
MLAEEGWKDHDGDGIIDKDGKKFEFTLLTNEGNKRRETITQIVQQQLKQVGIKVHPKLMEWSAFLKKTGPPNWDFDALVLGWSLGSDPDPEQIFSAKEIKQGLNNIHYKPDPEIEKMMQENSKIVDQDKRGEMIKKIQAAIAEDQPYTFLYYRNNVIIYNPKYHNVQQGLFGGWYHIKDWWMEQ